MPRSTRSIVAGLATTALLLGSAPAMADDPDPVSPATAGVSSDADEIGSPDPFPVTLPVEAQDVTTTDTDLRATGNEVTVLVSDGRSSPEVSKLRADSPADAAALTAHLDALPGVVAARTASMRAFGAVNTEPLGAQQWNLALVGAPDAWASSQGAGVVVAVIDTGVDGTHPDLVGKVAPEIDLLPEVTPLPEQNDHGTRVASLIAGSLNQIGMAGVAPAATILPVAALDPAGFGDSSTVARAIIAAADAGARVINLSLGGPDRDPVLDQACLYAYSRGAILVAAAGNSYQSGNQVQYPAASPDVLAVSSVDSAGSPSAFSNTGPHIDLAAPGQDILAAVPGGGYDVESGTSFATPHVAGALALVLSANPGLTAAQASSIVTLSAQDDVSGNGRDDQLGHGIVRPDRALATALTVQASGLPPNARVRLRQFNASPEPVRRNRVAAFSVQVQARYPDRVWRVNPYPALVRFEFRPRGGKRYRAVAEVASGSDGRAVLQNIPARSGIWRARIQQASGKWTASGTDYLKVRR